MRTYQVIPALEPRELKRTVPGVALWLCPLERTPDEIANLSQCLSPAERTRATRFGTDALRHRWIAGRTTLRHLLGEALGVAPADVAIRRGPRGRPELAEPGSGIDFNVSHTRDVGLFAIAGGLPAAMRIGVDIERVDRDVGADHLARKFLTPREQSTLANLDLRERRERFLRYWTCKEAMSKATSDGLAAPFGHLDVELSEPPRLLDGPSPYLPARWSLHFADVPDGWFATVALWHAP